MELLHSSNISHMCKTLCYKMRASLRTIKNKACEKSQGFVYLSNCGQNIVVKEKMVLSSAAKQHLTQEWELCICLIY